MALVLRIFCSVALSLLLLNTFAQAAPPDAGTLLNEQRQQQPSLPDRLPKPEESTIERPKLIDSGVKVTVKGFRFTGADGLATDAELQALVAGSIGRELSFGELQGVAAHVTNYLREKGYLLARAYLPKQDVTEGIIEIAIIAGRIDGKVRINVQEPRRVSQTLLEGIASQAVPEGSPARLERIERAALLLNDLPGISAQAALEPGTTPGTTRIVINATEGPVASGSIGGDNYGDRYTGTWRGTGQIAANDPFGLGDQLSFIMTGAEHMFQGNAAYTLPLGATGINWSLAYTGLYYELGGDLTSLNATGRADTVDTAISYPVLRCRAASIWGGLGFEYQYLTDEANGSTTRKRQIPVGRGTLTGSFFDSFGGGGLTSASIALYGGSLDLSGVADAQAQDDAGPGSSGGFVRSTYSLARLQHITHDISLFASVRGQFASGNLDSSQKFILGGPTGVRAYPVGEASGDEGHAFTIETRYDLPFFPAWATTQLVGFLDSGWVRLHSETWPGAIVTATGKNDYWLNGGGAGLNIGMAGRYSVRATYAHVIGANRGRTLSGLNSDNRSSDELFWLQGMAWF